MRANLNPYKETLKTLLYSQFTHAIASTGCNEGARWPLSMV